MLDIKQVSKQYLPLRQPLRTFVRVASREPVTALSDVSLVVSPGEVVGLIGPNGSGKSTLVKIIATLLLPTSGQVDIDGFDVVTERSRAKERLGVVLAEDRGLYWRLSGRRNLELFGVLHGLPRPDARRRAAEVLELVGLSAPDRLVFGYSTGMRARLNIARALMANPPLLVLDEAARSLDPVARKELAELIRRLADHGHAVLLASHDLDEVVAVSDRIAVLVGGTIRFQGAADELVTEAGQSVTRSLREFLVNETSAT